jgi:hypothetical protein
MLWHFPRGGAPGLPQRAQVLPRCESGHGFITVATHRASPVRRRDTPQRTSAPAVQLLDERRFLPPRPVEVEHDSLVAGDPAGLEAVRGRPRMAGRRRVRRRVPRLMPDRVGLPDSADAGAVVSLRTGELVGRHRRPGRRGGVLAPAASPPVPHPRRTLRRSLEEGLAPAGQRLSHTPRGAAKRDPMAAAACGAPIRTEV